MTDTIKRDDMIHSLYDPYNDCWDTKDNKRLPKQSGFYISAEVAKEIYKVDITKGDKND